MSADEPTAPTGRQRGPLIAAGAAAVLLIAVVVTMLAIGDDGPDESAQTPSTAPTTTVGPAAPATDGAGEPAATVPIGRIEGATAAEVCSGVLTRLDSYAAVVSATPIPDAAVVENFDEFTDEIFTLADGAEWGDRIIEELVVVRREWSNAAAAEEQGDQAGADRSAAAALQQLESTVATPVCPQG